VNHADSLIRVILTHSGDYRVALPLKLNCTTGSERCAYRDVNKEARDHACVLIQTEDSRVSARQRKMIDTKFRSGTAT
jgi:hypothetical protein